MKEYFAMTDRVLAAGKRNRVAEARRADLLRGLGSRPVIAQLVDKWLDRQCVVEVLSNHPLKR